MNSPTKKGKQVKSSTFCRHSSLDNESKLNTQNGNSAPKTMALIRCERKRDADEVSDFSRL